MFVLQWMQVGEVTSMCRVFPLYSHVDTHAVKPASINKHYQRWNRPNVPHVRYSPLIWFAEKIGVVPPASDYRLLPSTGHWKRFDWLPSSNITVLLYWTPFAAHPISCFIIIICFVNSSERQWVLMVEPSILNVFIKIKHFVKINLQLSTESYTTNHICKSSPSLDHWYSR